MYEITVQKDFSAAHQLVDYPGNCARWHGHNWTVVVHLQADALDDLGMAMDFRAVKEHLSEIVDVLDHTQLNELPFFRGRNPTSEVLARYVYDAMSKRCNRPEQGLRVSRVDVSETPFTRASYFEPPPEEGAGV